MCSARWRRGAERGSAGFTLTELAVVAAVVAIVVAMALPRYNRYVLRGSLHAAQAAMLMQAAAMGQYAQDHGRYPPGCASPAPLDDFVLGCSSDNAASPATYTITATGRGPAAGFVFTLDSSGARGTPAAPPGWSAASDCWVSEASGGCAFSFSTAATRSACC